MNGTPRLKSAFPQTPQTDLRNATRRPAVNSRSPLPPLPGQKKIEKDQDTGPLIPFDVVDPATQRIWAVGVYVALLAWRLYDWNDLFVEDADSFSEFGLFIKWAIIDSIFFYGLPAMRIPWLEWSWTTTAALFLTHALLDGMLMFRVPIPISVWFGAFFRTFYDREISISERSVKPADVLHNSSIILGRQIIHILPEGSATLNPMGNCFCLDQAKPVVHLPIVINQTTPILIEIVRSDIETNLNETITITAKQAKNLKKSADKLASKQDPDGPRTLLYPVKKTGLYWLKKVVDVSKLEVRRRNSQALIVTCPKARMRPSALDKCRGELSDITMEVEGLAPMKLKYSKTIDNENKGFSFQTVQPDNIQSPYGFQQSLEMVSLHEETDLEWARPMTIRVPLNESLTSTGRWIYSIDEIHDACGNVANFTFVGEDGDKPSDQKLVEIGFEVHERPRLHLKDFDVQNPMRAPKGAHAELRISFDNNRKSKSEAPYLVSYEFIPQEDIQSGEERASNAVMVEEMVAHEKDYPYVNQAGLYTLKTVRSQFCAGEVVEPSSVLLVNPPRPELLITSNMRSERRMAANHTLRL
jgi:nucleoporin POM152